MFLNIGDCFKHKVVFKASVFIFSFWSLLGQAHPTAPGHPAHLQRSMIFILNFGFPPLLTLSSHPSRRYSRSRKIPLSLFLSLTLAYAHTHSFLSHPPHSVSFFSLIIPTDLPNCLYLYIICVYVCVSRCLKCTT